MLCRVLWQVSFHRYGDYFPGTGAVEDVGHGKGRGYCVNVPLKDGMDDESYRYVYEPIMTKVCEGVRDVAGRGGAGGMTVCSGGGPKAWRVGGVSAAVVSAGRGEARLSVSCGLCMPHQG